MRDFRELQVWQKAHALVLDVYKATIEFPRTEIYGQTAQTRRSAVSVAANIAEGCGRSSDRDFAHFLQIAFGSASELEYHLLLVRDLGWLGEQRHAELTANVTEVKRMLAGLIRKLNADR